jgi:hypothetical protein
MEAGVYPKLVVHAPNNVAGIQLLQALELIPDL